MNNNNNQSASHEINPSQMKENNWDSIIPKEIVEQNSANGKNFINETNMGSNSIQENIKNEDVLEAPKVQEIHQNVQEIFGNISEQTVNIKEKFQKLEEKEGKNVTTQNNKEAYGEIPKEVINETSPLNTIENAIRYKEELNREFPENI